MEVKGILKLAQKATKLREEENRIYQRIEIELQKITGISCLRVGYLAGDGIGVCIEKDNNCGSAPISDVLGIINKKGTITEQELLDITIL